METFDIVIIVLMSIIVIIVCKICLTNSKITYHQNALTRVNSIMPLQVEEEYITRQELEILHNMEETKHRNGMDYEEPRVVSYSYI